MVFPWFSHGFPMGFPWFSHGFPAPSSPTATVRNARRTEPIGTEDLKPLAPELGFEAAREATGKIYETLEKLKVWDGMGWDDGEIMIVILIYFNSVLDDG